MPKFSANNVHEPLIPHEVPYFPFEKIGCDHCQIGKDDFLIITDYYSKWIEILPVKSKQASEVIENLKNVFSTHGIPKVVICDNMPFGSNKMYELSRKWNFKIFSSSPHYPRSNGQAEKAVGIAKMLVKKAREEGKDYRYALLEYRNHPITRVNAFTLSDFNES